MNREKLEKNIASNLTIDLDVAKFIEVTLLDIEKYANQRVIEELENIERSREYFERAAKSYMSTDSHTSKYIANRIKELNNKIK
tara:strand:- start:38 stop:289 length:252 start_codon:yes stop_codon:yes gene_type:complete